MKQYKNLNKKHEDNHRNDVKESAPNRELSEEQHNKTIRLIVLWGIAVNVAICLFFPYGFTPLNPIIVMISDFLALILGIIIVKLSSNPVLGFIGYNLIALSISIIYLVLCSFIRGESSFVKCIALSGVSVLVLENTNRLYKDIANSLMEKLDNRKNINQSCQ